jgi:hypothetical protein
METSNKVIGVVLAVAIVAGAGYMLLNVKSDRAKFEALRVGMTAKEVQDIVGPKKSGGTLRTYSNIGDNETLDINDVMELTLRNGRLVAKRWTKKERVR